MSLYIDLSLAISVSSLSSDFSDYSLTDHPQTRHCSFFHETKNMENRSSSCKSLLCFPRVRRLEIVTGNLPDGFSF